MSHGEPCGALPVVGVTVSAYYCESHQAWFGIGYRYREDGGGDPVMVSSRRVAFGPFDAIAEITRWCQDCFANLTELTE